MEDNGMMTAAAHGASLIGSADAVKICDALDALVLHLIRIDYRDRTGLRVNMTPPFERAVEVISDIRRRHNEPRGLSAAEEPISSEGVNT